MTIRNGFAAALAALLCSTVVHAHEGRPHLMGTVAAIDANQIVVQTTEGKSLSVAVDQNTKYRQGDAAAVATDLKVGDRVVLEVTSSGAGQTASEIRFAPAGKRSGHEEHHQDQ